jgi:hypothetical protein
MRTFTAFCVSLMAAAGVYGSYDMAFDIRNGTMIRYDHDNRFTLRPSESKQVFRTIFNVNDPSTATRRFYMDESEFSRGDGMYRAGADSAGDDASPLRIP